MKTETLKQFLERGGKVTQCPAQKSKIKHVVKSKTVYSQGRIRWQNAMQQLSPTKWAA